MSAPTAGRPESIPASAALLDVAHLARYFPGPRARLGLGAPRSVVRAVDDVSFTIAPGESLGLVGESGCGKSTIASIVLRLLEPTSGDVRFEGRDILALSGGEMRALRRRMQIVFQDPASALDPRMTVRRTLREPLEIHGLARGDARDARIAALLEEVGLSPDLATRYPHELSGGQRQRVGIARALAVEPTFLVCDEPVSALDVSVQAQVLNLLVELRARRQLTYLFIAHDLAVVRHVADRVAVMYLGKLVEVASAPALYTAPRHPYTRALLAAVPVPDPQVRPNRSALLGDPASAARPTAGCPFEPRCPHPDRNARCRTELPVLREAAPGHQAACHFAA